MKAFISVSVNGDSERFIFGHKLSKKHFDVSSNGNWEKEFNFVVQRKIEWSHLFVGFITTKKDVQSVLNEWHYAQSKGVPNLLFVEDTVPLSESTSGNIIVFNRKKPQKAIDFIKKQMEMTLPSATLKREDVMAWTLGGEALIDILEWFERDKKREKQEREVVAA
jgi:hypothetical protein